MLVGSESKVMIVGDVHTKFLHLNNLIARNKPDIVIVCGELGIWGSGMLKAVHTGDSKIYACDGNHDNHELLKLLRRRTEGVRKPISVSEGIYYIPRGTIASIKGLNTLFIGGAESIDKQYRTQGHDWFPEESITAEDINSIPDGRIDMVISHTAPTFVVEQMDIEILPIHSKDGRYNAPSSVYLDYVFDLYKPKLWYFGHWHVARDLNIEGCAFHCMNDVPKDGCWGWLG